MIPGENVLQTLQKIATVVHRLDELATDVRELRTTATGRLDRLEAQLTEIRERLVRVETLREADTAHRQADFERFQAAVERAEIRINRALTEPETPSSPPVIVPDRTQ